MVAYVKKSEDDVGWDGTPYTMYYYYHHAFQEASTAFDVERASSV